MIGLVKSADPADFAAASDKVAVFEIHRQVRGNVDSEQVGRRPCVTCREISKSEATGVDVVLTLR